MFIAVKKRYKQAWQAFTFTDIHPILFFARIA